MKNLTFLKTFAKSNKARLRKKLKKKKEKKEEKKERRENKEILLTMVLMKGKKKNS